MAISQDVQAKTRIKVELPQSVRTQDLKLLMQFIEETEALLPKKIVNDVLPKITLRFKSLSRAFDMPSCGDNLNKKNKSLYGFARSKQNIIYLHEGFLDTILAGSAGRSYNCGHKTELQLARATLIHEIAHIADRTLNISNSKSYRSFSATKASALPFLPFFKIKNIKDHRSPDPYEYKSSKEHFAVNLEFALLDPHFKCARPATYKLLNRLLGADLSPLSSCGPFPIVLNDGKFQVKNIDPGALYEIHYLEASSGKNVESRFGHSMFRMVFCKDKTRMGPSCRNDISEHIVVSYAANETLSSKTAKIFNGLVGGYTTNLFLIPLKETLKIYNNTEERDLFSYPLRLTQSQKDFFLQKVIEEHWTYFGKYLFLSNNCASESSRLLISNDEVDIKQAHIPFNLGKNLEKQKLLNRNDFILFQERGTARRAVLQLLNDCCRENLEKIQQGPMSLEDMQLILAELADQKSDQSEKIMGAYLQHVTQLTDTKQAEMQNFINEEMVRLIKAKGLNASDLSPLRLQDYLYGVPKAESIQFQESAALKKIKSDLTHEIQRKQVFHELKYLTQLQRLIMSKM